MSKSPASKPAFSAVYRPPYLWGQRNREMWKRSKSYASISDNSRELYLLFLFLVCLSTCFILAQYFYTLSHLYWSATQSNCPLCLSLAWPKCTSGWKMFFSTPRVQRAQTWGPPSAKQTDILHQHPPVLAKKTGSLGTDGCYFRNRPSSQPVCSKESNRLSPWFFSSHWAGEAKGISESRGWSWLYSMLPADGQPTS